MNTLMYEHPLTSEHLRVIRDVVRYNVVGPIPKQLACGDVGVYSNAFIHFANTCCTDRNRGHGRMARYYSSGSGQVSSCSKRLRWDLKP